MMLPAILLALFFNTLILIMIISMHISLKKSLKEFKEFLPYYIIILIITFGMMFIGFYEYTMRIL